MNTSTQPQVYPRAKPKTWLITGTASFIGMHTSLRLLERGDNVRRFADWYRSYYSV